jgi:probable HAF family extracellular repeat protein
VFLLSCGIFGVCASAQVQIERLLEIESPLGLSDRGEFVIGDVRFAGSNLQRAARWSVATGIVDLGVLPECDQSFCTAISADGMVVSGYCTSSRNLDQRAFRWVAGVGMQDLGQLTGYENSTVARATAMSSDGEVVVGYVGTPNDATGPRRAFRWTAASGMQDLGVLSTANSSFARGISSDGRVIVGQSGSKGFVWTQTTGMLPLPNDEGNSGSTATSCSSDGSTIAGAARNSNSIVYHATMWRPFGAVGFNVRCGDSSVTGVSDDGLMSLSLEYCQWTTSISVWQAGRCARSLHEYCASIGLPIAGLATSHFPPVISRDGSAIAFRVQTSGPAPQLEGYVIKGLPLATSDPDHNGDGFIDFFDYDGFVIDYESGNPSADFNRDGFLDFFDFDAFVETFELAC